MMWQEAFHRKDKDSGTGEVALVRDWEPPAAPLGVGQALTCRVASTAILER